MFKYHVLRPEMVDKLHNYIANVANPTVISETLNRIITDNPQFEESQGAMAVAAAELAATTLNMDESEIFIKLGRLWLDTLRLHDHAQIDACKILLPSAISLHTTAERAAMLTALANSILVSPVVTAGFTNIYNPATLMILGKIDADAEDLTKIDTSVVGSINGLGACVDTVMSYMHRYKEPLATVFMDRAVLFFRDRLEHCNEQRDEIYHEIQQFPYTCAKLLQIYYDMSLQTIESW